MPSLFQVTPTHSDRAVMPTVSHDVALHALPPRRREWPTRALVLAGCGIAAISLAGLLHRPDLLVWSIVLTVALVAGVVVFGIRSRARGLSIDKMIEAANPILQGRTNIPTRDLVIASHWRDGWIGTPGRLDMHYAADIPDNAPAFTAELVAQVSNRMGCAYKVKKNDARRCVITLVIDDDPAAALRDPDEERLESVLASVIPGAIIDELERSEDGHITKVIFRWPPAATQRAAQRPYQTRAIAAVCAALDDPTLTISFDLGVDLGTIAPIVPLPDVIPHPPRNDETPMLVAFGQFRDGTPCIWDLDAPLPHLLIVGGTGGGKTVLLLSILTSLPKPTTSRGAFGQDDGVDPDGDLGAEIWPIDPKRLGLFNLDLIPGAKKSATREAAIVSYILAVKKKMDARYEYLEENGPQLRERLHPIVLTVDEGEEMVDMLNEWWRSGAGKKDWCERMGLEKAPTGNTHPVMTYFGSILRLGREGRVHVVLASQQAASSWLSTSSRSQFAVRIALRNLEPSTSLMTFGSLIATRGLENKPGRAWVSVGMGVAPEHAQIYWTPKLAPGLNDTDREILHTLGITLPDDPDFTAQQVDDEAADLDAVSVEAPTVGAPSSGAGGDEPVASEVTTPGPRPQLYAVEPIDDDDDPGFQTFEVTVSELEAGMNILVDVDGRGTEAVVDAIDSDLDDPDYLVVSYTTVDGGESGAVSVPDAELVSVRLPSTR